MQLKNIEHNLRSQKGEIAPYHMPGFTATFKQFIQFSWPNFLQIRECTLLEDVDFTQLFSMIDLTSHSLSSVETQLNKRRLIDILPGNAPNGGQELVEIGRHVQRLWQAKLATDFPQKRYAVIFTEGDLGRDIDSHELTFFEIRS